MIGLDSAIGIEIKEDSLAMVCVQKSLDGLDLRHSDFVSLPAFESAEEKQKTLIEMVSDFKSKAKVKTTKVFVSIPRNKALFRYIRLPLAARDNLDKVLEYELERYIPFAPEEVYYDSQILKEEGENLLVLLVVIKKCVLDPYLETLSLANSEPLSIEVSTSALFNAFMYSNEASDGDAHVIIMLDDKAGELLLVFKGVLAYSRAFSISHDERACSSQVVKELENALLQISNELPPEEDIKPEYFKYLLVETGRRPSDDLKDAFKKMQLTLKSGFKPLRLRGLRSNFQPFAVSYGAALKGLKKVPVYIDLMPRERKQTLQHPSWIPTIILAFLIFTFGLSWGSIVLTREREELQDLNSRIARLKPEMKAVEQMEKQAEQLQRNVKALEGIKFSNPSQLDILRELTAIIPEKTYLTRFTYTNGKIQIEGQAPAASDLIPILEKSALFQEAKFPAPITKTSDGLEQFRIEAAIKAKTTQRDR